MSDEIIDPKEPLSRNEIIDQASEAVAEKFSKREEVETPTPGQEKTQAEKSPDAGGEPAKKTPTDDTNANKDAGKGFAEHPAWIERENKLKDAQGKLKEFEQRQAFLDSLLDDPKNYEKFLKAQGFSSDEIARAMTGKGFNVEGDKAKVSQETKFSIAEEACQQLGWDIKKLNQEQADYINDHVRLSEKVYSIMMSKHQAELDKRLAPLENNEKERQAVRNTEIGYDAAEKRAADEFPDLNWEKDIIPAMNAYLDDLDKRDPKGTIKVTPEDVYEKATRNLLKEKQVRDSRQADRNIKKGNAKPLTPGIPVSGQPAVRGKTWKETMELRIADR